MNFEVPILRKFSNPQPEMYVSALEGAFVGRPRPRAPLAITQPRAEQEISQLLEQLEAMSALVGGAEA